MTIRIFNRTPLLVIDTATNTYSRYVGGRLVGRWTSGDYSLKPSEVESLRSNPIEYFGYDDPRGAA